MERRTAVTLLYGLGKNAASFGILTPELNHFWSTTKATDSHCFFLIVSGARIRQHYKVDSFISGSFWHKRSFSRDT
jgi:hypothetical protein